MYEISQMVVLLIYLGILISWGMSVYDRIVNKIIRRYLIVLVGLMMFWMMMRTLRFTIFHYVFPFGQWCWYAYYVSMILIPLVSFLAAKYIGKPEEYRISKKWYLMYIPSVTLVIGILTNDLFEGRDIKLVGSDDHYFIFVAEVLPKKKYSNSLLNALREQGLNVMVEGKQKDDRQEFTVSDKAAGYMSESDLATLSNAQEKDVILLFVKVK